MNMEPQTSSSQAVAEGEKVDLPLYQRKDRDILLQARVHWASSAYARLASGPAAQEQHSHWLSLAVHSLKCRTGSIRECAAAGVGVHMLRREGSAHSLI